jgi:hypothetical protein
MGFPRVTRPRVCEHGAEIGGPCRECVEERHDIRVRAKAIRESADFIRNNVKRVMPGWGMFVEATAALLEEYARTVEESIALKERWRPSPGGRR